MPRNVKLKIGIQDNLEEISLEIPDDKPRPWDASDKLKMIGITEIAIIVIVAAIIFFGRNTIIEWAKTIAQVKNTYNKEINKKGKKK